MKLPAGMQVLERGWLSANNVLLRGGKGAVLVDSGYGAHAEQTLLLVEQALRGERLAGLLNTHCHSDHMGGNGALRRRHACRIGVPAGEAALVDAWDERTLILSVADQRAERFTYDHTLAAGDTLRMGDLDWHVLPAPGHDAHAVVFHSPEARVLISGDALWERGFGAVFPQLFGRETALAETRDTLDRIAALGVETVVPGHGSPFSGVGAALERAYFRLEGYEQDITRLARHCVKVAFAFVLLEKRSFPLAELEAYFARVPLYAEINRRYLGMSASAFAEWLIGDLERAGALRRGDGLASAAAK